MILSKKYNDFSIPQFLSQVVQRYRKICSPYTGNGSISGDPHVRVQIPGQQAICYDIHGDELDYVSLLYDANSGLEINGELSHVKANKSRLSAIGFLVRLFKTSVALEEILYVYSINVYENRPQRDVLNFFN